MDRIIKRASTALSIATIYPLFWLSCLVPRDQALWVFIGWHRGCDGEIFADNTKYLFLDASQHSPNVRAVWLAKDERLAAKLRTHGYKSFEESSLKGIWLALRAGTTVIDAYLPRENFRWSGRTRLVQLLHGKGFKKEGYSTAQFRDPNILCVPSSAVADMLPKSFKGNALIAVTGYARTDVFAQAIKDAKIDQDEKTAVFIASLSSQQPKPRLLLYAPTYRRGMQTFDLSNILPGNMETWLEANNAYLFINLHPKYAQQVRPSAAGRIRYIEDSDLYPLLPSFDILINDYSSIFADFLLLDRPIVFYPFDRKQYEQNEGFNVDYDASTPGAKASNKEELLQFLGKTLSDDRYAVERARVRALYQTYPAGGSAQRVIEQLQKHQRPHQ